MRRGPQQVAKKIRDELAEEKVSHMDQFRRFRHRIRNIYSFNLVPNRIKALVGKLPRVSVEINTSLQDFAQFLDRVSDPGHQ